jgi:deazaflavin-dependent oxidoreductase (nitroreductase family)
MADNRFLYLTTRGRVTGQPRTIEIWFVVLEDKHFVVAETREKAGWVKNLRADPRISYAVALRGQQPELSVVAGSARVLDEHADSALAASVRAAMDQKYEWSDGLIVELSADG